MKQPSMRFLSRALCAASLIALAAAVDTAAAAPSEKKASEFVDKVEATYRDAFEEAGRIQWVNSTYINFDTDWLAARSAAELTKMEVDFANEAAKYDDSKVSPEIRRKLDFMKLGIVLPAPSRDGAEFF